MTGVTGINEMTKMTGVTRMTGMIRMARVNAMIIVKTRIQDGWGDWDDWE